MAQESKIVRNIVIAAAAVAVAVVGVMYFADRDGQAQVSAETPEIEADVSVEALKDGGPLEDVVVGEADAPVTIIEYASMTCPHCADFHNSVFPKVKEKYIDTGKANYIFREFPLDILAARASMLARCAGPDRQMALVGALFETQQGWAVPDEAEAMSKMLGIARQAGFSKESFDKCMADEALYQKLVQIRAKASDEFGVNSTPSFFINGKKLGRSHQIEDFDKILDKDAKPSASEEPAEGSQTGEADTPAPAADQPAQ